jgi:predicted TPR repeat methyltransferase
MYWMRASIKPYARRQVGVDLSPGMLQKAFERSTYDDLIAAELTLFLMDNTDTYDQIVVTDILIYFGVLTTLFSRLAKPLRKNGRLIFTREYANVKDAPAGFRLSPAGRYSHTDEYLKYSNLWGLAW